MTTTEILTTPTRDQLSTWTFTLRRDLGAGGEVVADGAVFGDHGPAVLCWRDPLTGRANATGPATVTTLRQIVEAMCSDVVSVVWESGGPATEGDGVRTDSLCRICYAPMTEFTVDHDVIQTEGHCPDCFTREVWMLHPQADSGR